MREPRTRPPVLGVDVDDHTRCVHWGSARDIVAIRMKCCGAWYACKDCHEALAGHAIVVWPQAEWDECAVLCGACGARLTIRQYLAHADACPACGAPFNPGCRHHHRCYFENGGSNPLHPLRESPSPSGGGESS